MFFLLVEVGLVLSVLLGEGWIFHVIASIEKHVVPGKAKFLKTSSAEIVLHSV